MTDNYENQEEPEIFDFARHKQIAIGDYLPLVGFYADFAATAKLITQEALKRRDIHPHSIEARAKDPESFGRKAAKPSKLDPRRPMYPKPVDQITDKAAIRIITFFPRTVQEIDRVLTEEFSVIEHADKSAGLLEEDRFGYQSVHYLLKLNSSRTSLPEYRRFSESIIEVQVRTILQHAWAEIEHDIRYKSSSTIPRDIRRRFMSLAGLLEIADREFQAIQDADRDLTEKARNLISTNDDLSTVEITPNSLKTLLDKTLGPDGRMSDFSYDWETRVLLNLGFTSLDQVKELLAAYNDDKLSKIAEGGRQGQLTRFQHVILAGLGEKFIERHPFADEDWFRSRRQAFLARFKEHKIPTGWFDPQASEPLVQG